eukprot:351002-Chlamydomonas_euryale.AAC.22
MPLPAAYIGTDAMKVVHQVQKLSRVWIRQNADKSECKVYSGEVSARHHGSAAQVSEDKCQEANPRSAYMPVLRAARHKGSSSGLGAVIKDTSLRTVTEPPITNPTPPTGA